MTFRDRLVWFAYGCGLATFASGLLFVAALAMGDIEGCIGGTAGLFLGVFTICFIFEPLGSWWERRRG